MSMKKRNAKMAAKCQSVTELIRTKATNKNKKLKTNGDWQTVFKK